MKKNYQQGFGLVEVLIVIVLLAIIVFLGWRLWEANNQAQQQKISQQTEKIDDQKTNSDYLGIKEWNVRFPQTIDGKYKLNLSAQAPSATFGGPADLESQGLLVEGFSKGENKCVLPYEAGSVNRHKDKNPTLNYQGVRTLDPIAEVKIGEWWYSTTGLDTSSDCFEGMNVSQSYKTFTVKFLDDFKKIKTSN